MASCSVGITKTGKGIRFKVLASPKSSKTEVVGLHDGAVRIRLAASPVKGAANKELISCLGKFLGMAKSRISIVSGHSSKNKMVEIKDMTEEAVRARIETLDQTCNPD